MKFSVLALFAMVLSPAIGASVDVDAPPADFAVTLVVKVTNGTARGRPVTDDQVLVRIFHHEQLTDTIEGKADASGQAVFENVPAQEHAVAVASARHNDMMFGGRAISLTPGSDTHIAHVTVYDVSEDNSKLSVGMHHFIIKAQSNSLLVTEYMQLKNVSDMAVISKERDAQGLPVVLKILLPGGFANLQFASYFQTGAVVVTEDGFYDTMATPPGANHKATFSYTLDIDSATMDIAKMISLPTSEFVLFSQLGPGKIKGLASAKGQMTMTDGTSAEYFSFSELNTGDTINFQVTGFNVVKSQRQSWIIMGVVFGIMAVVAVLRLHFGQRQP
jgi:hypothetical protein